MVYLGFKVFGSGFNGSWLRVFGRDLILDSEVLEEESWSAI